MNECSCAGRIAALEARVAQLEAGRACRPRDRHDVGVVGAIVAAALGTSFTSVEVWRHARVHVGLRDALDAAFIDSPVALGLLCRRMRGVVVDGYALERTDDIDRKGIVWHLRECKGQPSQSAES